MLIRACNPDVNVFVFLFFLGRVRGGFRCQRAELPGRRLQLHPARGPDPNRAHLAVD